jgi:hypothetical protein
MQAFMISPTEVEVWGYELGGQAPKRIDPAVLGAKGTW